MIVTRSTWLSRLGDRIDAETLRPDLGRAIRGTIAIMLPLILAAFGKLPFDPIFFVIPAHGMACWDVRGPYGLRLAVLALMVIVITAAAAAGTAASGVLPLALIATAGMAMVAGVLRHLTVDYGQSLAATTALIFFMALLGHYPGPHWPGALAGATWAVLLQIVRWPIRPQQPLRQAVADSWLAAADLFNALAKGDDASAAESAARAVTDRTYTLFATLHRSGPFRAALENLHTCCAQLITRGVALRVAVDALPEEHQKSLRPPLAVLFESLGFNARVAALATVSNQPGHLAISDVRLRRAIGLVNSLAGAIDELPESVHESQPLTFLCQSIEAKLRATHDAMHALSGQGEARAVIPLELFDLATWRWRPLAPVLNLRPEVDRALVRFTLRLALELMLAVLAMHYFPHLPHRYWLPFTMVIVTQIDFGATRKKAAERLGGTLIGSIIGSIVLSLRMPIAGVYAGIAATGFGFAYLLRRRYWAAVMYVTVMVVLLTESGPHPVTLALTEERLGLTVIGGAVALLAAFLFWPAWERERTHELLLAALRCTADYARIVRARLAHGRAYGPEEVKAKRLAESAAAEALASLSRIYADPKNQRAGVEQAAVLANGTRRITRMLNLLLIHERAEGETPSPAGEKLFDCVIRRLDEIVVGLQQIETNPPNQIESDAAVADDWVTGQLSRMLAELGTMRFSLIALAKSRRASVAP